eukprot:jgi/Botrbrau1/17335/Bobra.0015s0081.1
MFEADLDDLDLGSKRNPVQWVSMAPPLMQREKRNPNKRNNAQRRARSRNAAASQCLSAPGSCIVKGDQRNSVGGSRQCSTQDERGQSTQQEEAITHIEAESEEGNVEYKLRLKEPTPQRFHQLVTQLKFRLSEGNGECFYYVGVEDDGYLRGLPLPDLDASIATLYSMAREVQAAVHLLGKFPGCRGGTCALVRVYRLCIDEAPYTDLRVAVVGGVDSGKSTLVAVLTHGREGRPLLDDGRGSARLSVLRHKHEIVSGRTSSIAQLITGYDADGRVLNYAGVAPHTPAEIATLAGKVLRFIDLGGHEKYLKTALYGLTCMLPDCVLLCVCPSSGVNRVTREHLAAALALDLPLAILLTKVDSVPATSVEGTLQEMRNLLAAASGAPGVGPIEPSATTRPVFVAPQITCEREAVEAAACPCTHFQAQAGASSQITVPVFAVSSVTGSGLSLLHAFLSRLQPLQQPCTANAGPDLGTGIPDKGGPSPEVPMGTSPGSLADMCSSASSCGSSSEKGDNDCEGQEWGGRGRMLPPRKGPGAPASDSSGHAASECGPLHFQVDHMYEVKGVGSVVSGTVVSGVISLGQQLLLGPSPAGTFDPVRVYGIQRAQLPVRRVKAGQHATLAIQPFIDSAPDPSRPPDKINLPQLFAGQPKAAEDLESVVGSNLGSRRISDDGSEMSPGIEPGMCSSSPAALIVHLHGRLPTSLSSPTGTEGSHGSSGPLLQEGFRIPHSAPIPLLQASQGRGDMMSESWGSAHIQSRNTPTCLVGSSPSSRKGAVLLHGAAQPKTAWQFEAVLVLLSGHWPARGLLSRRWPPEMAASGTSPEASMACLGSSPRMGRSHCRRLGGAYSPVIHCGSVRQAAHVVHMEEVAEEVATIGKVAGCSLASALAAGAALLSPYAAVPCASSTGHVGRAPAPAMKVEAQASAVQALGPNLGWGDAGEPGEPLGDASGGDGDERGDLVGGPGCTARVRFRFVQRPEWLRPGARLIVRDPEDGGTAGAGVIERVLWDLPAST